MRINRGKDRMRLKDSYFDHLCKMKTQKFQSTRIVVIFLCDVFYSVAMSFYIPTFLRLLKAEGWLRYRFATRLTLPEW